MQVDYGTYKKQDFACKHCSWQGKGSELILGDYSDAYFICDLECPKCLERIAFWQAPLDKTD